MTASPSSNLREQIRREIIGAGGTLSFARFMELALYAPELGYYERTPRSVGAAGDFYTNVSVGPLFGEMLAEQFAEWLEPLADSGPVHLVEAGAHDGRLAADVLAALEKQPWFARLEFWLVEPSLTRRQWQQDSLSRWSRQIRWANDPADLAARSGGVRGVWYSNELLDAFPVHVARWRRARRRWEEYGVALADDAWQWRSLSEPTAAAAPELERLNELPAELRQALPDGFATELAPAATAWWEAAAHCLREGKLITVDYGLTDEEFLLPHRAGGTLRSFARHQSQSDVLANPGAQDLTAHVHFTALLEAGERAGLVTEAFTTQRQWLTERLATVLRQKPQELAWDSQRVRQFQTLTHPEHLGRAFRVLIQRRQAGL